MRRRFLLWFLPLLLIVPGVAGRSGERVSITLLGTTDLHGNLYPIDYYADKPANLGLAKIATLVAQVRAEQPNVLLLDSGDTTQGTPLVYYFARKDTSRPNPIIAAMNALGYTAMACGNHEFNFGLEALWKAKGEAKFPILAANVRQDYASGVQYFQPYIIQKVAGVKVGIVGFITPSIPSWEVPQNYRGYQFLPIVDSAHKLLPELRKQVDLLVVLAHSGLGRSLENGKEEEDQLQGENSMWSLAESSPEIDVILFGHTHRELKSKRINNVLLAQAKNWGQSLARVDISVERDSGGRWAVASKESTTIPVTDAVTADPRILELMKPYHERTQAYLDTPIAASARDLTGATARVEDHPLVDLIHKVQMASSQADVSLATMLFTGAHVPAGQVTIRQLASVYVYENSLYAIEMTGAQLRAALEHAASFYPSWPPGSGETLKLPNYNADSAAGVSYILDLSQPLGKRIRDLAYQGAPLRDDQKLRVATNNYRYSGGGKYAFNGLPVVYRSPQEIRDLMIEYVSRVGAIPTEADGNWKIAPSAAAAALIQAAQQQKN